ncbi:MAG: stimulus-sensing domain-containing protein [Alphaproteobacteria bacterium]
MTAEPAETALNDPATPRAIPDAVPSAPRAKPSARPGRPEARRPRRNRLPFRGLPRLSWFIFALNTFALLACAGSIVAADHGRVRLIDARKQQLAEQGQIFSEALAVSAVSDRVGMKVIGGVVTPIPLFNPGKADEIIRNLVLPTKTRARLYDYQGHMLIDSKLLEEGGAIDREDLAPPGKPDAIQTWIHKTYLWLSQLVPTGPRLPYEEVPPDDAPNAFQELASALVGVPSSEDRYNGEGELIVSVGMPVRLLKVTAGALLLTTEGGDIDEIIRKDNEATLRVVLVSFLVSLMLSTVLARSIATPIRALAHAADEVATGTTGNRVEIPNFGKRHDEIGELSTSLGRMTKALYDRIEAIERFAADVSHEIKNPLTSIRSAVETLQFAKRPEDQKRLTEIVRDDVRRLDRLITDISAASRLDAELARGQRERINLVDIVRAFVDTSESTRKQGDPRVTFDHDIPINHGELYVQGTETRLAQVLHNLVGNARSFSPSGGTIRLHISVADGKKPRALLTVDDDGPGIPEDNLERIFERFYTSRPGQEFGKNSGLGLSICRQIIEAHGGQIWAGNRKDAVTGAILGARFSVSLPLVEIE